jgi:hypothetical protein
MVFKTQPDAACDLHAEGMSDAAHSMRLYANADGYVRVHVSAKQETQEDARVQLDCTSGGKVTAYPLRLRAASSVSDDMPAPQSSVPALKGSRVLPALTDADAQLLTDQNLIARGYPIRPDAVASPDTYAKWLDLVARPITLLPSHSVSRSDISHHQQDVQAGLEKGPNWSGYEAHGKKRTYMAVQGEWNVPQIVFGESGYTTYSAFWVGLDGDGLSDLVQAGTEQDYVDIWPFSFASYSAWTELLPNQPTEQDVSLSPNPGDDIFVSVWIGDSSGFVKQNGGYGWFYLYDKTQGQAVQIATSLSGTYFNGEEAEWIMERPTVGGTYAELSGYVITLMANAYALPTKGAWKESSKAANRQLYMYNQDINHPDNDLLSISSVAGPNAMFFNWVNFH